MNKITCMIVEDEPHAMQLVEDHIGKVPFLELKACCYDALEALEFLKTQPVDVLFLDITMPQLTGLEMAAVLPANQKIIFTTAYSEYALDSFDYHVIDYLLKPITFRRFIQAVNKLQASHNHAPAKIPVAHGQYTFVKSGKQLHKIEYDNICYMEALKEYIAIHTPSQKYLVYKRMKEMAETLPAQFVRIHNSYIVNIVHIKQIGNNLVEVAGKQLPVSSSYKDRFQQKIMNRIV